MKKVDFLFIYEVKNRELENICLLAAELEKRGFERKRFTHGIRVLGVKLAEVEEL